MTDDRDHTRQGKHRSHPRGLPIVTPTPVADAVDVSARLPTGQVGGDGFGEAEQPITGIHSGEALARLRAARPTDMRIGRLEQKHDALASNVSDVRASVGRIEGQLTSLPKIVDDITVRVRELQAEDRAREHVTFTAKVDVDRAQTVATIEDGADQRRARRERVTKIIGGVIALLSSGALLHWLAGRL